MKKQDKIQDNIYAILYKRQLLCDDYYVFFPCQCVEGCYDTSDKSFIDMYGNIYYSCSNHTMINTGQSFTYYYDTSIDDIINMMGIQDREEAVSKFYDKLKSNLLIGHVNDKDEVIELYELTKEKLDLLTNNVKFSTNNGKGNVVLSRSQFEELLKEDNQSIKDKIRVLFDKLDYLEKFSKDKKDLDLSVVVSYNSLMTKANIEKAKMHEEEKILEQEEIVRKKDIVRDTTKDVYEYITQRMVGQDDSVKVVLSSIVNNLYARSPNELIRPFIIGGTGSGKSYLFKLIERGLEIPVIIVDCNQLVQSGYEGKMIDDVLKDLYLLCDRDKDLTENAVVVFDEIDKIGDKGATVSEIGVQQTLLKFIEGQKYVINMDKYEMEKVIIDTSMMTIAACGAFEGIREKEKTVGFTKDVVKNENLINRLVKNGGMIPELLGRFNLYVEYNEVTREMIKYQLENSITSPIRIKQDFYLDNYGMKLVFTDSFLEKLCDDAVKRKTGFRGVDQVVNQALSEVNFVLQTSPNKYDVVIIDKDVVENPKRFILHKFL